MKTIIYYFTGTGNSLAAARSLAGALGETELVSIASLADTPGAVTPDADRVGIVCPVYDFGVPLMVASFAERLDLSRANYTFAVVTMGGMGVSALHQLDRILRERQGRGLDGAFAVRMPANFPPLFRPPEGRERDKVLDAGDVRLGEIAEAIGSGRPVSPGFAPISRLVRALTCRPFAASARGAADAFSVSDACTGCGTCAKVCPAGNIEIIDGRPVWGGTVRDLLRLPPFLSDRGDPAPRDARNRGPGALSAPGPHGCGYGGAARGLGPYKPER